MLYRHPFRCPLPVPVPILFVNVSPTFHTYPSSFVLPSTPIHLSLPSHYKPRPSSQEGFVLRPNFRMSVFLLSKNLYYRRWFSGSVSWVTSIIQYFQLRFPHSLRYSSSKVLVPTQPRQNPLGHLLVRPSRHERVSPVCFVKHRSL